MTGAAATRHAWHSLASGARRVLAWWGGELTGMVPRSLEDFIRPASRRLVVQRGAGTLTVSLLSADGLRPLAAGTEADLPELLRQTATAHGLAAGDGAAVLLAADDVLVRTLTVPRSALSHLTRLMIHEVERRTSFTPDEVYLGSVVLERPADSAQARVAMVIAERSSVAPWLQLRRSHGAAIGEVIALVGARVVPLDLPGGAHRSAAAGGTLRRRVAVGLAAATLLLAASAFAVDCRRDLALLDAATQQLQRNEPAMHEAAALRRQIAVAEQQAQVLRRRRAAPKALHVLDELARVLPDDTWLASAQLGDGHVSIVGHSSDAARLVTLIEASALFRNAQFRGPVVSAPDGRGESFELSLDLAPTATP